ncbi:protein S40-1-like [Phragmites australis]|uniref:protein S40-1-like n=1 Tax=Phragmites australis TaxID=29695 RepID=UPI002D76E2CF|nr:protein S40-1-like [Phragmites australis]
MAMEELDEFEVLWPDAYAHAHAHAAHEPPASSASPPVPVHPPESLSMSRPKQRCSARSRPVDVPSAARLHRCNWKDDDDDEKDGVKDIVPPHLLVSGMRRSEVDSAWTLRTSRPPCKRARELRHLRNSVLRMTGFIEG